MSGQNAASADAAQRVASDRFHARDELFKTIRTGLRCAVGAFGLFMAERAIEAVAGQSTTISVGILLRAFADLRVEIAIGVAGLATGWAMLERRQRQRTIDRLHRRISELELKQDPLRLSSGLTTTGKTNPRDREL